jgi:hypothetical protein
MAQLAVWFSNGPVGDASSIIGGNMTHLKHDNDEKLHRSDYPDTSSIDAMMREVLHMLGNIDFAHDVELEKVDKNGTDQTLKTSLKRKIVAAHYERREPYVALLTTLRQRQHRLSHRI